MDKYIPDKVKQTCLKLLELSEKKLFDIEDIKYYVCDYKAVGELPSADAPWQKYEKMTRFSEVYKHYWLSFAVETPSVENNNELFLNFSTGRGWSEHTMPHIIAYINGEIKCGIDGNHRRIYLEPNKKYNILIYAYIPDDLHFPWIDFSLKSVNLPLKNLYYDIRIPYDTATTCFDPNEYNYIKIFKYLDMACNLIDFSDPLCENFLKSVEEADEFLHREFYEKECGNSDAIVHYVGHTHIDVAWLWTLAQTREKVQRTFSSMIDLLERYPDFKFMSSQPQLYEYCKIEQPELYEKIKKMAKEGRWEVEGAMWLEADCNLSSGESLVRQILHGKNFMKDEFGVDSKILWLPDVFGYSAALPQILQKSGVDKFVTSKISWSEYNQLPYDTFMWQGIDGTELFTYFLTAKHCKYYDKGKGAQTTYNGGGYAPMCLGTWERYQQKEYNNETVVTFGWGDGGGGTDENMIEEVKRLEYGLPGMPKAKMSTATEFLTNAKKKFDENCVNLRYTPKWVGELYLEFHRGTYTSIARNKKNNRECEFLCQTTEALGVTNELLLSSPYPQNELHKNWRTILLNQFHDIIPGSSIKEVYEVSDKQYAEVRAEIGDIKENSLKLIANNVAKSGLLVYNPNSFEASSYVKNGDHIIYAENIPALGWKVLEDTPAVGNISVWDKKLENAHYIITFDDNMNISSIFDKDNNREVIEAGNSANQLTIYEDYPKQYDNWEITKYYKEKSYDINSVQSVTPISGDGFGGFRVVRNYQNSKISQDIIIYSKSRRIDFKTKLDWHEKHKILKAKFPTSILSTKATYEIQFGNVERPTHENTSWDAAKFEVCAQKWADLSEEGYGLSLLNNCKYGHSTSGNVMSLTLLKCGTYPNPDADQGEHTFTYSILPHADSYRQAGTINEAYLLNRPLEVSIARGGGNLPESFSLASSDCENIIIETIKKAEKEDAIIVRLYDAWGKKSSPVINLGFDAKEIWLADMMENKIEKIGSENSVKLDVKNFEIVTLLIK